MYHYLDVETEGINAGIDRLITIQTFPIDEYTFKPLDQVQIFKAWELGNEKKLIEEFLHYSGVNSANPFGFVPVGYNLNFDLGFLMKRADRNSVPITDLFNRPSLDLRAIGVLMNKGQFKGSGLDKLTGKPHDGAIVPVWYSEGNYEEIESYIRTEAKEFMKWANHCFQELPEVLNRFRAKGIDVRALQQ